MKRFFDITLSFLLLMFFMPVLVWLCVLIKLYDKEATPIYWSKRIGKNNRFFFMPKLRTMKMNAPQVATHLMTNPDEFLTPIGKLLRKTSLDELPQLWSILMGDMSFVGPRPALFNQDDLKEERTKKNLHALKPGLTGWAQINGRDELTIPEKVELDEFYKNHQSFYFDLKIIVLTIWAVLADTKTIKH